MGSVVEQLAHLQEEGAARRIGEVGSSLRPADPELKSPKGELASSLVADLVDGQKVLPITQSDDSRIAPEDQPQLLAVLDRARIAYHERGQHGLCLTLGTIQTKDAQVRALVKVPIFARQPDGEHWEINWSLHPLEVDPWVAQQAPELAASLPGQPDGPAFSLWWSQLCGVLEKEQESAQHEGLNLHTAYIACLSDACQKLHEDLDPGRWGGQERLACHPILSALLGPGFLPDQRQSAFTSPYLEGEESASAFPWIEDADKFQAQAILAAASGENIVIQGPYGSGKTQTITNILAQLVSGGKRVLLLSPSMRDLQAVKQRLVGAQLDHACLSIYDQKRHPLAAAIDLVTALRLTEPKIADRGPVLSRYNELHRQLNDYTQAMRIPLGQTQWCYQEVVGQLLLLKQDLKSQGLPKLNFEPIAHWTQEDFEHAKALVSKLAEHIQNHGSIAASPFVSLDLNGVSAETAGEWCDRIASVAASVQTLLQSSDTLFSSLDLPAPNDLNDVQRWVKALDYLQELPDLSGFSLDRELWTAKSQSAVELLACGSLCASIRNQHQARLLDQAWSADLVKLRGAWRDHGEKWWRKASKRWREAKAALKGFTRGELPDDPQQVLTLIDAVIHYQSEQSNLTRLSPVGEELYGHHWCGPDSNWDKLQTNTDWLVTLLDKIESQDFPPDLWKVLTMPSEARQEAGNFCQLYTNCIEELQHLQESLGVSLCDMGLEALERSLCQWSEDKPALLQVLDYRSLEQSLRGIGLGNLVSLAQSWELPLDAMVPTVALTYLRGLEALAFAERAQLREATSARLSAFRAEFSALDRQLPIIGQEALNAELHRRRPAPDSPQVQDLRQALADPRKSLDLSKLLSAHREVIGAIKPIVLATPWSLPQAFSDPAWTFDTVLIDSAGSLPLSDAMGAILRSDQVIAVGDSRHSPPSIQTGDAKKQAKGKNLINAQQSILYRCRQQGAKEYLLSLHYRSRHDSLIHFVNQSYYDGKLRVAPSPAMAGPSVGVYWRPNATKHPCTNHATGENVQEARVVALAAAQHLLHAPDQSLGILTLSRGQAQLVQSALHDLAQERPELHALLDQDRQEPFFVRALQDVPREDRCTIYLSVGYGFGPHGEVSRHWGPLHGVRGHHKLSMALSRARTQFHVFSNIEAQDFVRDEQMPTALSAFVGFLEHAQGSTQRIADPNKSSKTSSFALQVRNAIRDLGFVVRSPTAEHEVDADLYVYDPDRPDVALVGILCDTQRYHQQKVVRDRERISSTLLYRMGWKLHRVWCRDWLSDPDKETTRLAKTLTGLRQQLPLEPADPRRAIPAPPQTAANQSLSDAESTNLDLHRQIERESDATLAPLNFPIYRVHRGPLALRRIEDLAELASLDLLAAVEELLSVESCMHTDLIGLRIAQFVGLQASHPGLREQVAQILEKGVRNNRLQRNGAFVSLQDQPRLQVRNRCALPSSQKRMAWIPPAEMDAALLAAARQHPNASHAQILQKSLQALGLDDRGSLQRNPLVKRLLELDSAGKLREPPPSEQIDDPEPDLDGQAA